MQYYELTRQPVTPEDSHFVMDCAPDVHVSTIPEIDSDTLYTMGVRHILLDVDGTIVPNGKLTFLDSPSMEHLKAMAADPRFSSFSLATDNMSHRPMIDLAEAIGPNVKIFQPIEEDDGRLYRTKVDPKFWERILAEIDVTADPDTFVMIGDSPLFDIAPAQRFGMKTVQIDRLEASFRRPSRLPSEALDV